MSAPATNQSKIREYLIGSLPRLSVVFRDKDGEAVSPNTVRLKFRRPSGAITTWVYGVDPEIECDAETKEYSAQVSADAAGEWVYRWEASGNYQAAAERKYLVAASQVV